MYYSGADLGLNGGSAWNQGRGPVQSSCKGTRRRIPESSLYSN